MYIYMEPASRLVWIGIAYRPLGHVIVTFSAYKLIWVEREVLRWKTGYVPGRKLVLPKQKRDLPASRLASASLELLLLIARDEFVSSSSVGRTGWDRRVSGLKPTRYNVHGVQERHSTGGWSCQLAMSTEKKKENRAQKGLVVRGGTRDGGGRSGKARKEWSTDPCARLAWRNPRPRSRSLISNTSWF